MKTAEKSIFNLIEIFRNNPKSGIQIVSKQAHCEQKQLHDFYCDAEKPFVTNI